MAAASDTGASSTDNLTSVSTPIFSGTAEAGSYVELLLDGGTVLGNTNAATPGGAWTITASTIADGAHTISARVFDSAGNVGVSTALSIVIDTTPPAISIPDMTAATDTGSSSIDNLTKNTKPTFIGTSQAGATITLLDAGSITLGTATADGLGNWTIAVTGSPLSDGAHNISARSVDLAGNQSTSGSLLITIVTTAPNVSQPNLSPASDTGNSNVDRVTSIKTPTFTGTGDTGATVELLDGTTVVGTTTVVAGSWSITSSPLADGVHSIAARATDAAGNVSPNSAAISVTIDTAAPTVSGPI